MTRRTYTDLKSKSLSQNERDIVDSTHLEIFNVQGFGGFRDGVGDNSVASARAINAAIDQGGGIIYYPPGTWLHKSPFPAVSNVDNLWFLGAGRGASQIKIGAAMDSLWSLSGADTELNRHITISNLGFINPGRTYDANLFDMSRCSNWTVRECLFENIKGRVFDAEHWFDSSILDCIFQDCGDTSDPAVYMQNRVAATDSSGCNNIKFTNCQFEANRGAQHVLMFQSARRNSFTNCKFHGELPTAETFVSFEIDGDGRTDGGYQNVIQGCYFAKGGLSHIKITGNAHDNVITGNRFNSAGEAASSDAGVWVDDGDDTVIIGNSFDGNSQANYGVHLDTADGTIIVGNTFTGHTTSSIRTTGSATNTIRHSNTSDDTRRFNGSNRFDQLSFVNETNNRARVFEFRQDASTPADNDGASIGYTLKDSGGADSTGAAELQFVSKDVTATTEDAEFRFLTMINGSSGQNRVKIHESMMVVDGITEPATESGWATIYVDTADGALKVKFGDGFVATIVADS